MIPGILKHGFEQVLTYSLAYGSAGTKPRGKRLLFSTTIRGPYDAYKADGFDTFTAEQLITPLLPIGYLTGMPDLDG